VCPGAARYAADPGERGRPHRRCSTQFSLGIDGDIEAVALDPLPGDCTVVVDPAFVETVRNWLVTDRNAFRPSQ
jgi:hypothetical protein